VAGIAFLFFVVFDVLIASSGHLFAACIKAFVTVFAGLIAVF
jgi:hypothetical protein